MKLKSQLLKNIFSAYLILILHVGLLAGVGIIIIIFKGLYQYLPWVIAGSGIVVVFMAWFFYTRVKQSSSTIKEILSMPQFQNSTTEIKLLGGLASFKLEPKERNQVLLEYDGNQSRHPPLLESDIIRTEQKILKLSALFEKGVITREEFQKAKQDILQG